VKRIFTLGAAAALVAGVFLSGGIASADQEITNEASLSQSQSGTQTAGDQSVANTAGAQSGTQTASATSSGSDSQGNSITQGVGNSVLQGGINGQENTLTVGQQGTISQSNTQFALPSGDQTLSNTATGTLSQFAGQTAGAQASANTTAAQTGTQDATAESSGSDSLGNLISQTVLNAVDQEQFIENLQANTLSLTQVGSVSQTNLQAPPP
jgi:hypothetical protein